MPKIRKIETEFGASRLELELHYNANNKFFIKGLPEHFEDESGFINRAETEAELIASLTKCARELGAAKTVTRYFIAVDFIVNGGLNQRPRCDFFDVPADYQDKPLQRFGYAFGHNDGAGFSIGYQIVVERTILGKVRYNTGGISASGEPTVYSNNWNPDRRKILIEYSAERLAFIKAFQKRIGQMAFEIGDFLTQNPDDLGKLLDQFNGAKALPATV